MLPRARRRFLILSLALSLSGGLIAAHAAPVLGSAASEERQGQQILGAVESGSKQCAGLSGSDFELVGEYVMGRMAGSTRAHEQMNQLMQNMMGKRGEEQMHAFMGRRFTRCGGGQLPGSFAGMMGSMGMMGGSGMMGGRASSDDNDGWSAAAIVMTALMAGLLVLVAALLFRRPSRGPSGRSALAILNGRYASGEIDTDEYDRRRKALGGT